jgi:hypothetical protein
VGKQVYKRKVTNRSNKWKQWFVGNDQEQEKDNTLATFYFRGEASWAQVFEPVDKYKKEDGKEWKISLKLDDASQALFHESGCGLEPSKKDGSYTFRRPTRKLIKDKLVEYAAPLVLDKTNTATTDKIGNGSIVTVKVDIYPTRKGKGHTLEAVRVEELVPYEGGQVEAPDDVVPF